jgi:hypothetical protein
MLHKIESINFFNPEGDVYILTETSETLLQQYNRNGVVHLFNPDTSETYRCFSSDLTHLMAGNKIQKANYLCHYFSISSDWETGIIGYQATLSLEAMKSKLAPMAEEFDRHVTTFKGCWLKDLSGGKYIGSDYTLTPLNNLLRNITAKEQPFQPTPVEIYSILTNYRHSNNPDKDLDKSDNMKR